MNKKTFIHLINSPVNISDRDLEDLEELAVNFPYCQIAHILIAKGCYDKGNMLVHQKIKKASAYSLNRSLLKKVIVSKSSTGSIANSPLTGADSKSNNASATKSSNPSSSSASEEGSQGKQNNTSAKLQTSAKSNGSTDSNNSNEIENNSTNTITPADQAITTSNAESVVPEGHNPDIHPQIATAVANDEKSGNNNTLNTSTISDLEKSLNLSKQNRKSFYSNPNETMESASTKTEKENTSLTSRNLLKPRIIAKDKRLQNELIDRFITSNPRLTPANLENKNIPKDDLSLESSKLDESLISENMAVIYLKQGKTDKAIDIYKRLSLKYPEKSTYFAGKIDKLEKN